MKHLLNDMSEQEKNAIREQHTGGIKLSNEKFLKLLKGKLGDVKTLVEETSEKEQKEETKESFWNINFGKPSIEDAAHTHIKRHGYKDTGKDDPNAEGDNYIMYMGQKFHPEDIEYAEYDDMGDLPRAIDGKLIIANPAWKL